MRTVAEVCVLFVSSCCPAPQHLLPALGDLSLGGGPGSEGGSCSDLRGELRSPKRSSEGGSEELLDLGVPLGGEAEPAQVGAVARGEELHGALQRGLECRHLVHRV